MKRTLLTMPVVLLLTLSGRGIATQPQPLIIDHACTDITRIPAAAILNAKTTLHIAYGHTSHGSQITDGMTGLVAFANGGGKGLSLPKDFFAWNGGGVNGALDLRDYAMPNDVGYYPDWVVSTRAYLNDPNNAAVNVIMWSWCGEASGKYANGTLLREYLDPMNQLEKDYPNVAFVYMTGHVDHSDDADNKAADKIIRDYCVANKKILFDFADIDSHDPNGTYYPYPNDNCDYYAWQAGALLGNWAQEWQNSHTVNVDWYVCGSAHSEPVNANQKAYAAWWLFARLAVWPGPVCSCNTGEAN
jgi:hypothetical protein